MLSSNNAGLWFRLIIFMLLSAVLALFIGQSFIAQSEQKRLVSYAQEVLAQGVAVAQESQDTMHRILLLGNVPCSDADLRELRLLSFYALNLRDVGRIENDRLICSAGWGRLNPPIALLPPDLTTPTGTQLWTAMERLVDPQDHRRYCQQWRGCDNHRFSCLSPLFTTSAGIQCHLNQ